MNNPLDGTGAMYDDEKIFPRLLQALIEDANIDVVTINLEANDPRPKELKSGNRFAQAIETAAAASKKPIACFSSVVGGPVDPEILLPLRKAGVPLMEGAECATATIRNLAEYYEFQINRQSNADVTPSGACQKTDFRDIAGTSRFPTIRRIRHSSGTDGADSERRGGGCSRRPHGIAGRAENRISADHP